MFLLKERRPEYRDKWEVTGVGGQPLQITVAAYSDGAQQQKKEPRTVPVVEDTSRQGH